MTAAAATTFQQDFFGPDQAFPAETKPRHFHRRRWTDLAHETVGSYGACVVRALATTLGCAGFSPDDDSSTTVVWMKQKDLTKKAGVTRKTFAKWSEELVEAGLLLKIPALRRSRQQYYVLTFPAWSHEEALEYAGCALKAYSNRPDIRPTTKRSMVRDNVLPAVAKAWKCAIAQESFEDPQELEREIDRIEGVVSLRQGVLAFTMSLLAMTTLRHRNDDVCAPDLPRENESFEGVGYPNVPVTVTGSLLYKEISKARVSAEVIPTISDVANNAQEPPPNTPSVSTVVDLPVRLAARAVRTPAPQTPPRRQALTRWTCPETFDLEAWSQLGECEQRLVLARALYVVFERYTLHLNPRSAELLAQTFLEAGALPPDLEASDLPQRLLRHVGCQRDVGTIIQYLDEDVRTRDWTPPPGQHYRRVTPPTTSTQTGDEITSESSSPAVLPDEEALALARSGATPLGRRQAETVWEEALEVLSGRVSKHLMQTWILGFRPIECVDGQLVGMEYDDFRATWVRNNHAEIMSEACGMEVVILSPEQVFERYRRED
jgi:hypothetical protein